MASYNTLIRPKMGRGFLRTGLCIGLAGGLAELGVVWLYSDSLHEVGEYAILLRSSLKGRGLGWALMQLIIEYAKSEGLRRVDGQILQENSVMLKMCRELGFKVKTNAEDRGVCDVTLVLEGQESRDRDAC